jgi:hypothetical protein
LFSLTITAKIFTPKSKKKKKMIDRNFFSNFHNFFLDFNFPPGELLVRIDCKMLGLLHLVLPDFLGMEGLTSMYFVSLKNNDEL